jgi:hypothetical protein
MGCDYGAWAGTSAQGSGPAKGLAALVDAATDETDTFSATSNALAKGCLVLGVRGYTVGQGFGGSFLWDYWDRPPFDNLIVTDLSAGLLVRGGMCGRSLDFSNPFALAVNANVDDPCDQRAAGDSYYADATADNTWPSSAATSWAQTRVQGSGNGALPGKLTAAGTPAPAIPGGSFDALGLGATADFFGDDSYTATANALSTGGAAQRDDFVAAQGAGTTGFGVLVNIGDVDSYSMAASTAPAYTPATWFAMWPWMVGQADAVVPTPVSFKVCVSISCTTEDLSLSGGILVDVFGGAADSYSLAPACPNNGLLSALAPYTWGNQLTATCTNNPSPAISNGIIFGLDA